MLGQLFVLDLFILVFELTPVIGFSVVYSIKTTDCGVANKLKMLNLSMSLQSYGLKMETKNSIVFEVKGPNDAGIYAMDSTKGQTANNTYRFFIGSYINTLMETDDIRYGQWTLRERLDGSFLDANAFKRYWFSWKNGKIQAGQGDIVGMNVMMTWTDPNPFTVHYIGIGTCWGATGKWKIKAEVEDDFAGYFSKCQRSNSRSELPIIANFSSPKVSCAADCASAINCFGFNYHTTSNRCELLSYGDEPVTDIVRIEIEGWNFYAKCYDKDIACVGCFF